MIPMKVAFVCFARISGWHLTALNELIMDSFHYALAAFGMGYAGRATSIGFGEVVLCMHLRYSATEGVSSFNGLLEGITIWRC